MKLLLKVVCLVAAAALSELCNAQANSTISGFVTDKQSHPLEGARVTIIGNKANSDTTTDSEGAFIISLAQGVEQGHAIRIRIEKFDYKPYDRFVAVSSAIPLHVSLESVRAQVFNHVEKSLHLPNGRIRTSSQTIASVYATRPWTDTGVQVTICQTYNIATTGTIIYKAKDNSTAGPDGEFESERCRPGQYHGDYVAPQLSCHSLIGKIGDEGVPFEVGSSLRLIAQASGALFLGFNDSDFSDNSGVWSATIDTQLQVPAASKAPPTISLGYTPEQVEFALGPPDKKVDLGSRKIWTYKDIKVTFTDCQLSDAQ